MSIKKLFDSTNKTTNYLSDTTQKDAFESVESDRNLEQLKLRKDAYIPQVDYSKPAQFAKFGSAYLYYKSAFNRILDYYPYDGSDAEINKFYNQCLDIEKYIIDNIYPRATGYITLGKSLATPSSIVGNYGLHSSADNREYIQLYGGPGTGSGDTMAKYSPNPYSDKQQYSNIYDENMYQSAGLPDDYGKGTRTSNLRANFDDGVTLEFWLKTGSYDTDTYGKAQVVFDMWNNAPSSSTDYGRFSVMVGPSGGGMRFILTAQSGANGVNHEAVGDEIEISALGDWQHYAVSVQNSGSSLVGKLYVTGTLAGRTVLAASTLGEFNMKPSSSASPGMYGRIGSLITAPSGTVDNGGTGAGLAITDYNGAGRLSGSVDEFRYWKEARTPKDIGINWFSQVRGGVNTDISNATLGVYYKFNGGITGTSSVDKIVLDYAGRITNGVWAGYTSNSRNTGSAILSASAAISEYEDPIIRKNHPEVLSLETSLEESGSFHDLNNNSNMLSFLPGWIIDDEEVGTESNLQNICHIVGAYFDKLYLQISELPKLKQLSYTSASQKPISFAEHLPQSLGLYSPDLFIDASVLEKFANRNDTRIFEGELGNLKNEIYINLYNNLTNIYKSKGTEKAIKNVFRCFNIDEKLIKLNVIANNTEYLLSNNLQQVLVNQPSLTLNHSHSMQGVVYQSIVGSTNSDALGYIAPYNSLGYSSGDIPREAVYGLTTEANVIFPYYNSDSNVLNRPTNRVSLFGLTTVDTGSATSKTGADTAFVTDNFCNFQVRAVKETQTSKNVYFELTSAHGPSDRFPHLTSSKFLNVYNNEEWNLSVRVKPSDYPYDSLVSGSGKSTISYDVIFHGTNTLTDRALNSFTVSGTMTRAHAVDMLSVAKRMYVGAERTNVTGTVVYKSDVMYATAKHWLKYLDNSTLLQHSVDSDNVGISSSIDNISAIDVKNRYHDISNYNMLALDWKFNNVTASDGSGNFVVQDFSSGSAEIRNNFDWVGKIAGYQLPGIGTGFVTSSAKVISREPMNTYKFVNPEQAISADMIQLFNDSDRLFPPNENAPDFFYSIEKSMYNAVSEEMLDFMAGVVDFHDVIGAPVNRYRINYKQMEKLRETFFRRVTSLKEVEKYIDYYKWFDESVAQVISQLMPASMEFAGNVSNVIESHVLERNKYKSVFPTLKFFDPDLDVFMYGLAPLVYSVPGGTSPVGESPRPTKKNEEFWRMRAEPSSPEITSGNPTIDKQRKTFKEVMYTNPHLSQPKVFLTQGDNTGYVQGRFPVRNFAKTHHLYIDRPNSTSGSLHAGVNFEQQKSMDFPYTALRPAGPVNTDSVAGGQLFVPMNTLMAFSNDLLPRSEVRAQNVPASYSGSYGHIDKSKKYFKVNYGREFESDSNNYYNVKSDLAFPFNIISSSVTTGYNALVVDRVTGNIEITNLHNDVYGDDMERPMQGSWPEHAVGGHQSRHVKVNDGTDNSTNRPEAWRILLGRCDADQGAIGMVGPDYPFIHQNQRHYTITGCANTNTKAAYWTNTTNDSIMANTSSASARDFVTGSRANGGFTFSGWMRFPPNTESPDNSDIWSVGRAGGTSEGLFLFKKGKTAGSNACAGSGSGNWLGLDVQTRSTNSSAGGGTTKQIQYRAYLTGSPNVLNDGDWHHVSVALSGTNGDLSSTLSCSIYVDGTKLISCRNDNKVVQRFFDQKIENFGSTGFMHYGAGDAFNFSTTATTAYKGDEFMVVGGNSYTSTANQSSPFSGAMDQLVFWTTPLTDAQISTVYNNGVPPDITGSCVTLPNTYIHAWYKMGEGASPAGTQDDDIPATGNAAFSSGSNVIWDMSGKQNHMWTFNPAGTTAAPQIDLSTGTGYTPSSVKAGSTQTSTIDNYRSRQYPATSSQKAYLYRDFISKTPYVMKNIHETTSSRGTILGNYRENYQIVCTVGAWSNPRHFVDQQPTLPSNITSSKFTTSVRTYLSRQRTDNSHFNLVDDYSTSYLTGANNKSIITQRFSNPGGIEQMTRGFQDFRSTEFSVYNQTNYRNLSLFMESQVSNVVYGTASYGWDTLADTVGKTASAPQIVGRVDDILGKGDGLRAHLSRHTARFGRDSLYQAGTSASPTAPRAQQAPGATYVQWPNFHKTHRNTLARFELNAACIPVTASVHDNYFVQHQIPRSDKQYAWITGCIDIYTGSNDYPNPIRYSGYQKTGRNLLGPFYSSSRGYEDFFNFVSSSQQSGACVGLPLVKPVQPISRMAVTVIDEIWTTPRVTGSTYAKPWKHADYGQVVNIMGFPRRYDTAYTEPIQTGSSQNYSNYKFAQDDAALSPNTTHIRALGRNNSVSWGNQSKRWGMMFNMLMAKRENNYGWTWRASPMRRGKDHPILLREQKRNKISTITGSNLMLQQFDLPPVSTRGRPARVNLETVYESKTGPARTADVTLKVTHNNEQIFFPDPILNNYVGVDLSRITTPLENLVSLSKIGTVNLNWILYTENVFPSSKNSFTSASTQRIGYDNHFWRNGRNDRTTNLYSSYASNQSFNSIPTRYANLSMWPLDAPQDFLTRTDVASTSITRISAYYNFRRTNTAGELQNTYYSYFTGGLSQLVGSGTIPAARYDNWINKGYIGGDNAPTDTYIYYVGDQLNISALYARKHMNAARLSCVAPAQIVLEGTGTLGLTAGGAPSQSRFYTDKNYSTFMSGGVYFPVETYSGEALWQAPSLAGTLNHTQSSTSGELDGASSVVFQTQSSSPWGFNDYSEYSKDLNLMSRGYAIVPEFRISEHVEDYINYGVISDGKTNTFEIPGTGISSVTSSFYKDYSNSEFLTDFLNLREDSLLGAKEIRLVCSAAIRYNPYKGFYPAQRTLDLNGKFATAYHSYLNDSFVSSSTAYIDSSVDLYADGGNLAPLWRALFAPGLMYNTIKSGMAVDYPIVMDPTKIGRKHDFAGMDEACAVYPLNITTGTLKAEPFGYKGSEFFDKRLPFETLINPIEHLEGVTVLDMESHLSSALPYTASWTNAGADTGIYPLMASNFFGEVGRFFLKDENYTKLESNVVPTDLRFETGSVYGARIRMVGSSDGTRKYANERDSRGYVPASSHASRSFAVWGMRVFTASAPLTNPYQGGYAGTGRGSDVYITIPQDPKNNRGKGQFNRNFIMYSRPTAFGPPIAGRSYSYDGLALTGSRRGVMDSFEGYNWAYTPPYTNGECWADLVFWPKGDKAYDLEQILAETHIVYRRVDPGPTWGAAAADDGGADAFTSLILGGPGSTLKKENPIYSGPNINSNAMQLSASLNLLGIENIFKTTADRFGETSSTTNEVIGKKWIIQPKFETPMMNFSDESSLTAQENARITRPISVSSSTLTLPLYGSASVPRGMWHQFGTLPERPDHGIFMDIGAIPEQWLRYHYDILNTGSIYNNYDLSDTRRTVYRRMKSLAELGGFQKTGQQKRLGELKEKTVIKEAIVAVPYIVEESDFAITSDTDSPVRTTSKKFIDIPKKRFKAAMARVGSREANSLGTAGASIRKLVQKIPKYVLPPQLDFVNNRNIDPIVMYIFEFEYKFDRDDLSYIWQNLAPRNSRKITFQHSSVAHELVDTELLNEKALLSNQQLRWMVFKVKQRATGEYYNLVADQAGQASTEINGMVANQITAPGYKIQYNWPYDYLSFVELIKMDVDVLYRAESVTSGPENTVASDPATAQEALAAKKKAALDKVKGVATAAKNRTGGGVVKTTSTSQGGSSATSTTTAGASATTTTAGASTGGGGTTGNSGGGTSGGGSY